jgi:hypothetical protein
VRVMLTRQDAIEAADRGSAVELSLGKLARVDRTPGLWDGQAQAYRLDGETDPRYWLPGGGDPKVRFDASRAERFDAIQRDLYHNHLAQVPAGRAKVASLRLDAAGNYWPVPDSASSDSPRRDSMDTVQLRFDDEYLPVSPALADRIRKERADHAAEVERLRADQMSPDDMAKMRDENEELKKKLRDLEGKADEATDLKAKLDELTAKISAPMTPAQVHALYESRRDAVTEAKRLKLDESLKLDELETLDIKRAALKAQHPEQAAKYDAADPAFVEARFDALVEYVGKAGSSHRQIAETVRHDGAEHDHKARMDAARKRYAAALAGKSAA